jgi:membrane protease YdiL (CAAX protease family)
MITRLSVFVALTFGLSWLCWFPIIHSLSSNLFDSSAGTLSLFFAGAYAPTIVGITLAYLYGKGAGLRALLKRTFSIKIGIRWLCVSLLAGPFFYAVSVFIYSLAGGELGTVNRGLLPWIPVVFLASVIFGPLAEELGWRGFALPQLDHRTQAVSASVIIGIIWAGWHAPLFWAKTGTAISGFPVEASSVALFFAAVLGSSFIYTWLFNHTNTSVFAAIMLHLSMNASGTITGMFFPEMTPLQKLLLYKYYVAVIWVCVILGGVIIYFTKRVRSPEN